MFGRLKYWLLCWLLGDICKKSVCRKCELDVDLTANSFFPCNMGKVYGQAKRAWKVGGDKHG